MGLHVEHQLSDHRLRQVHVHPVRVFPETLAALFVQLPALEHGTAQLGNVPTSPGAHRSQSLSPKASNCHEHVAHVGPVQRLRHWHVQPVAMLPETDCAPRPQLAATVHVTAQLGYPE